MTITTWPSVLTPRRRTIELRGFAASGGQSITGDEFLTFSPSGKWELIYGFEIRTRAQALAFGGLVSRLRTGEYVVAKVFDRWQAAPSPAIGFEATALVAAAKGATELVLATVGLTLEWGVRFSIGNRLYRIMSDPVRIPSVVHLTPDSEVIADTVRYPDNPPAYPDQWTVKILPPLRAAVAAGAPVDFRDLKCLCRMKTLTDGDLDLDRGRFADPTLPLIEAP